MMKTGLVPIRLAGWWQDAGTGSSPRGGRIMLRAATLFALLLVCCILVAVPLGCSKSDPSGLMNNIPPETPCATACG
jgi:hypothetical protein